jgi:hypothetical protein
MQLSRRQFALTGGGAVASGAIFAAATRALAASSHQTAAVDRWLNEVAKPQRMTTSLPPAATT